MHHVHVADVRVRTITVYHYFFLIRSGLRGKRGLALQVRRAGRLTV